MPGSEQSSVGAAPGSFDRSDCSSIASIFTPRPEGLGFPGFEQPLDEAPGEGDRTPRLGFAPRFSLQPYLTSYKLHAQVKSAALAARCGGRRHALRPQSAPPREHGAIVINGVRYLPAGRAERGESGRSGRVMSTVSLSRTYTAFAALNPDRAANEGGRRQPVERQQNQIRTRPWTANANGRPLDKFAPWALAAAAASHAEKAHRWTPEDFMRADRVLSNVAAEPSRPGKTSALCLSDADDSQHQRPRSADAMHPTSKQQLSRCSSSGRGVASSPFGLLGTDQGSPVRAAVLRPNTPVQTSADLRCAGHDADHRGVSHSMSSSASDGLRPASANRIRFDDPPQEQSWASGLPSRVNFNSRGASRTSNVTEPQPLGAGGESRPTSASARRKLQHETESITRYSQDPIHPERLEVTYVNRKFQREDSRMKISYDDDDASATSFQSDGNEDEQGERGGERRHLIAAQHALPAAQRRDRQVGEGSLSTQTHTREHWPARAGDQRKRDERQSAAGHHAAISSAMTHNSRGECETTRRMEGVSKQRQNMLPQYPDVRSRPLTAPMTRPGSSRGVNANTQKWEHRMERVWEQRFASMRSRDNDDHAEPLSSTRMGVGPETDRHRPKSASGVMSHGGCGQYGGVRNVEQLRQQMLVIEDAQRDFWVDLDRTLVPQRTGIDPSDPWLRKQQGSAACVVQ